jgi:PAS domain-containing protein
MRSSDSPGWDASAEPENLGRAATHFALENLFEFSPDAIFVTDASGAIVNANPRATQLFGYARSASAIVIPVIARTIMRILAPARWARP